jgi:hypothetical protein
LTFSPEGGNLELPRIVATEVSSEA